MKKLLVLIFAIGLTLPMIAQSGGKQFFKTLSQQRGIHPTIKEASAGLYKNYTIRDSLLYFTGRLEQSILQGKSASVIKPETVKMAQRKFPGKSLKAVRSRLELYATEGKSLKKGRY